MGDVIDINEGIPHVCIVGPLNEPHVIPVEALRRMAKGVNPLIHEDQREIDIDMIQGIISAWLSLLGYEI